MIQKNENVNVNIWSGHNIMWFAMLIIFQITDYCMTDTIIGMTNYAAEANDFLRHLIISFDSTKPIIITKTIAMFILWGVIWHVPHTRVPNDMVHTILVIFNICYVVVVIYSMDIIISLS